jgi:hypothetical protein
MLLLAFHVGNNHPYTRKVATTSKVPTLSFQERSLALLGFSCRRFVNNPTTFW